MNFQLRSNAFKQGEKIPLKYTCEGEDISPPLSWSEPPSGTKSFVLIGDDPDAKPFWTHWVIYNIPATARSLDENLPKTENLADGSSQGITSFGHIGYGGPCPPSGIHHYFFKLYALDLLLKFSKSPTKQQVEKAMEGHFLGQTHLMGTYQLQRKS